ncbi:glutathione S-transferase family protein [Devosia sp.]|uniref:glutathione S-transferase family protein n=1 Tax=Devosia sp. TaxID=1871048 RepID=UPI003A932439
MTTPTLFGLPPSTYTRTARMALAAKGVAHDFQPVDFRSDAYRDAHHPFSRVPAFTHGTVRLFETLAITSYVDMAFEGPALQPQGAAARAEMLQWISVFSNYIYDAVVGGCITERVVKPMRGLAPDEQAVAAAVPLIRDRLAILDARLADSPWFAGEDITLADYFYAPVIAYLAPLPEGKALLPELPALTRWLGQIEDRPELASIIASR